MWQRMEVLGGVGRGRVEIWGGQGPLGGGEMGHTEGEWGESRVRMGWVGGGSQ